MDLVELRELAEELTEKLEQITEELDMMLEEEEVASITEAMEEIYDSYYRAIQLTVSRFEEDPDEFIKACTLKDGYWVYCPVNGRGKLRVKWYPE